MKSIAQQLNITKFPFEIKNKNGKQIYYETSDGYWVKREFDSNGKQIYFEDSNGEIRNNRPKIVELTLDEIADKFGIDVKDLKVKK